MLNLVIDGVLIILFVAMAIYALYVKFHQEKNTRERFAFYAFGGMTSLCTFTIKTISQHESTLSSVNNLIHVAFGLPAAKVESVPWSDHALMVVVFISACFFVSSLYRNWHGQFSKVDDDRRRRHSDRNWAIVGIADAYRRAARLPAPVPFSPGDREFRPQRLDVPGMLTWHVQARELYQLRHRSFRFDSDYAWRDTHRCWIGENLISHNVVALVCVDDVPSDRALSAFVFYVRETAAGRPIEYIWPLRVCENPHPCRKQKLLMGTLYIAIHETVSLMDWSILAITTRISVKE
jgi:hypothetical protein